MVVDASSSASVVTGGEKGEQGPPQLDRLRMWGVIAVNLMLVGTMCLLAILERDIPEALKVLTPLALGALGVEMRLTQRS